MAQRATSLGPKPSFIFFVFSFFCFLFCLFFIVVFLFIVGEFKGQVRWPKGPPHLALNPPYVIFVFCLFFVSLSLLLLEKTLFSPKRGIFVYFFCVSLCFSLAFLSLLLFHFFFLCLSLSLLFFSCFLPFCFHFCICFLLFLCFFASRCYFVFVFCFFSACCLVCFQSSCWISFCFVCYVLIFGNLSKNISEKWKLQNSKNEKCRKTDILTRAVSTIVFTNSVFLSFLCFFIFFAFC